MLSQCCIGSRGSTRSTQPGPVHFLCASPSVRRNIRGKFSTPPGTHYVNPMLHRLTGVNTLNPTRTGAFSLRIPISATQYPKEILKPPGTHYVEPMLHRLTGVNTLNPTRTGAFSLRIPISVTQYPKEILNPPGHSLC